MLAVVAAALVVVVLVAAVVGVVAAALVAVALSDSIPLLWQKAQPGEVGWLEEAEFASQSPKKESAFYGSFEKTGDDVSDGFCGDAESVDVNAV